MAVVFHILSFEGPEAYEVKRSARKGEPTHHVSDLRSAFLGARRRLGFKGTAYTTSSFAISERK
jgi:hypothetical protein